MEYRQCRIPLLLFCPRIQSIIITREIRAVFGETERQRDGKHSIVIQLKHALLSKFSIYFYPAGTHVWVQGSTNKAHVGITWRSPAKAFMKPQSHTYRQSFICLSATQARHAQVYWFIIGSTRDRWHVLLFVTIRAILCLLLEKLFNIHLLLVLKSDSRSAPPCYLQWKHDLVFYSSGHFSHFHHLCIIMQCLV